MKTLQIIASITTGLTLVLSALAQDSIAVEGKVIETATKAPIGPSTGPFTVKAYPTEGAPGKSPLISSTDKALAQTLTRADGTYSLKIPTSFKAVILRFDKLSYFSVPPQQTVMLTPPKTIVPDVAAMKYSYGKTVSTHDLLDAFAIRATSVNTMTNNLPPSERQSARKKAIELDIVNLQKAGVGSEAITAVTTKFLPP